MVQVTGKVVERSRPTSVTRVEPLGGGETQSRASSARSLVSSMFSGSEESDDQFDSDAYVNARKINSYGQVRIKFVTILAIFNFYYYKDRIPGNLLHLHDCILGFRPQSLLQ